MTEAEKFDVIIAGAGAVGLLLGNLLGQRGLTVLLLEKERQVRSGSRAIGIAPPSLEILKTLQMDEAFVQAGVKVRQAMVHGSRRILGKVIFDALPSAYPYIVSLPQEQVETLLEKNLRQYPGVTFLRSHEAIAVQTDPRMVQVSVLNRKEQTPTAYSAPFLCACDGKNSFVREQLKIPFIGGNYRQTFLMADYHDESGFGDEAHLFFTHLGPVESFPLPGRRRRWIVDTPVYMARPEPGYLETQVLRRSGIRLEPDRKISESPFGVQHYQATDYYRDRVFLCGDAAHIMSPIGGQGMNTGFGDAEFCATLLTDVIRRQGKSTADFQTYQHYRSQAAAIATRRAALSMTVGTMKGTLLSLVRNTLIHYLLRIWKIRIPLYFSMLNLPYHNQAAPLFPDLTERVTEPEWMDDPYSDETRLARTLGQFYWVNRFFSRSRRLLAETILADMLKAPQEEYRLLDVGAGGGDIARWFSRQCVKRGLRLRITCLDHDRRVVDYARKKCAHDPRIEIQEASLFDLQPQPTYDYIFANHFLHHLPPEQVPEAIDRIAALTKRIFLINDLVRSRWAYAGFKLFAGVWLHRSFAAADGLLSIRKGFRLDELSEFVRRCRCEHHIQVRRLHPARIVLLGKLNP